MVSNLKGSDMKFKFICIKIFGRILQLEYKDSYEEILDELGKEHKWWLYETDDSTARPVCVRVD